MFGFDNYGVSPDIVVMGKALGGGLPIGAFSASSSLMKKLELNPKLGHITTFGGNPVIAASALATLKEIENSEIINKIAYKEKLFRKHLVNPKIKKVQGTGLMLAPIFKNDKIPNYLVHRCLKKGLILFWLLWEKNAIRISPPLTILEEEIIHGCKIISDTLDEI